MAVPLVVASLAFVAVAGGTPLAGVDGPGAATRETASHDRPGPTGFASPRGAAGTGRGPTPAGNLSCRPGSGAPDPPTDRLGWERGCWYNETLDLRRADGFDESEVNALAARSMARIEVVRELEFTSAVTVQVRPRSSFDWGGGNRTVPPERRLRENVRDEALFLVGERTDAGPSGGGGGGGVSIAAYYAYWDDRVVLVSRNDTVGVHEFNLAHELAHALQDNHFETFAGGRRLLDRENAKSSVTEGGANYVTQAYKQRCRGAWNGTCYPPPDWEPRQERDRTRWCDSEDPPFNWGRHLLRIFPYSDGPAFVEALRARGGWDRVARAQRRPPNSTEQVIHPGKYPTDRPTNVTLRDRSSDAWQVIRPARDRPTRFRFGEAGLYVMLWYQWFATDHRASLIPCEHAFRPAGPRDMYNYSHPVTAGWDGDTLLPYAPNGSVNATRSNATGANATGLPETGYVWKVVWDRPRDARAFAAAYRTLLDAHNATRVPGRANTFRIPETSRFGDAVYLRVTNATVLVVNAPTVEALRHLRPDAAPRRATTTAPAEASSTATERAGTPATGTATDGTAVTGPGFGVGSAVVALGLAAGAVLVASLAVSLVRGRRASR